MPLRLTWVRKGVPGDHPGVVGNAAGGSEGLLAADRDAPQAAIDGIRGAKGRDRQVAFLQILQLVLALEGTIAYRGDDFQLGSECAQCNLEADLVVARG